MSAESALTEAVSRLRPVTLGYVLATAELQTRVDRKYVVSVDTMTTVLDLMGDRLNALEIGDLRLFRYESVYFDTPGLSAYLQHARGRRRRVKIRTRAYLDSGECQLEFKSVGARGETIKERYPYPLGSRHGLDADAHALAGHRVGHIIDTAALRQVLTTVYQRATLMDPVRGNRVTCDINVRFENRAGQAYGPVEGLVVLESKTIGSDSPIDYTLRRLGSRPVSLSKYCVGMAVLDPALPANRWNRDLRTHFGWSPRASWATP